MFPASIDFNSLTDRQMAILTAVALPISRGFSSAEVGRSLGKSSRSVNELLAELREAIGRQRDAA